MKIRLLKVVIVTLILIFTINEKFYANTYMKNIHWVNSYDEGLKEAKEKDKNIFVLITAPSWCHYCKLFEKKILAKEEIQNILNENYVPVLVIDQIDGIRNPDLSRFIYPGFPSVYVYNRSGNMVKDIFTQDANVMLSLLKKYKQVSNKENIKEKDRSNRGGLTPEAKEEIKDFMNEWVRK